MTKDKNRIFKKLSKKTAILISSNDKYADCWKPLFHSIRKYWPDCPFNIYTITNYKHDIPRGVQPIKVGEDEGWATNLLRALNSLSVSYVLYLQEDYWLNTPVDTEAILSFLRIMENNGAVYIRLVPYPPPDIVSNIDNRLGVISSAAPYRTSLQPAIWSKSILKDLLLKGETPWEFEQNGTSRSADYRDSFLSVRKNHTVIDYVDHTAVIRGKWSYPAQRWVYREGIEVDFSGRPREAWFDHFRRSTWLGRLIHISSTIIARSLSNPRKYIGFIRRGIKHPGFLREKISQKWHYISREADLISKDETHK